MTVTPAGGEALEPVTMTGPLAGRSSFALDESSGARLSEYPERGAMMAAGGEERWPRVGRKVATDGGVLPVRRCWWSSGCGA